MDQSQPEKLPFDENRETSPTPLISQSDNQSDGSPFKTTPPTIVEPSTVTALAVKPYNPEPLKSKTEMTSVLESDRRALLVDDGSSDEDSLSSDNSDDDTAAVRVRRRQSAGVPAKWWFQEPPVKRNVCIVIGAWTLVFLGIASFITGIILEATYHTDYQEVLRGILFIIIAIVVLLPSVYAVSHIYLAAKRVGRIRFSNVWFFSR